MRPAAIARQRVLLDRARNRGTLSSTGRARSVEPVAGQALEASMPARGNRSPAFELP